MYDAAEFRKRAQHCVQQANNPGLSQIGQTILLQMAAKWIELAEDAERVNALMADPQEHPTSNNWGAP